MIFNVLAYIVDTDDMPHYTAFYLGLHCLLKYYYRSFSNSKQTNF